MMQLVWFALFYSVLTADETNVLVIGDSNSAMKNGWPSQLSRRFPDLTVCNLAVAGNTVAFDNLDKSSLNALTNINETVGAGIRRLGRIDVIIVMLGTNDCKATFVEKHATIGTNVLQLVEMIQSYPYPDARHRPEIILLTPPPVEEVDALEEKYTGSAACVTSLRGQLLKAFADDDRILLLDIYDKVSALRRPLTSDGVHLLEHVQIFISDEVAKVIKRRKH